MEEEYGIVVLNQVRNLTGEETHGHYEIRRKRVEKC